MKDDNTQALLVVSFGTSYEETRKKTIEMLETRLADAFPKRKLYRAWTSNFIIKKVYKTHGLKIDSIEESLERMETDGITDILVQPTHLIDGFENRRLFSLLAERRSSFNTIRLGNCLLSSDKDVKQIAQALNTIYPLKDNYALILMGHGSSRQPTDMYARLEGSFRGTGNKQIYIGTIEDDHSLERILDHIRKQRPDRIVLAPLMIVAGSHVNTEMAGDDPASWKNVISTEGFDVRVVKRGLGEYKEIANIFVARAIQAKQPEYMN